MEDTNSPSEVDAYHTLCPLRPSSSQQKKQQQQKQQQQPHDEQFGHPSTCYRATCSKDGLFYCLRRLHGT